MKISHLFFCVAAFAVGFSKANTCSDGKLESHILPDRIGRAESGIPEAYLLKCDTMEVRVGDTTRIFSSQKIHFGPASTDKKIILVRGTLIIEGTSAFPTLVSGSLTEFAFGLKPGKAPWGGFRVGETGTLILKYVTINNASFAIDSRSTNVKLDHVYTRGCLNLVKPGNEFIKLDFAGTTIDNMDFAPEATKVAKPEPVKPAPDTLDKPVQKKSYAKPLLWGGVGVAALGAAGAIIWLATSDNNGGNKPPVTTVQTYPDALGFPQSDGPRKP